MTFDEALDFIHSFHKTGKKNGFLNINRLLELLNNPHKSLKFVHVAGTNGKGSTVSMLASSLYKSGYKTGMFISPFILEFRERIQINGTLISKDTLISAVEHIKPLISHMSEEGLSPSEFEVVTALAMYIFSEQGCDIVVLEVGLGGRDDVTNVIDKPLVSVITSISLDHMDILGDTIEKIARHKCGIIKPYGITVCYPSQNDDALAVIMEECAIKQNVLVAGNTGSADILSESLDGTDIIYKALRLHIPLLGKHQIANCITAVETLLQLRLQGYSISDKAIIDGIASVHFPVRMEIISRSPLVIIDGAHNEDGMNALVSSLSLLKNKEIILVIGMLKDKEYKSSAIKIASHADKIITAAPSIYRSLSASELAEVLAGSCDEIIISKSLQDAYEKALSLANNDSVILICGSLYLASDMRSLIK